MSEETAGGAEAQNTAPPILINAQYTKDLSFEAPTAPGIFSVMQQSQPEMTVNVNVTTAEFDKNVHEVVLDLSAHCKVGEDVAFIVELEYAGLFTLNVDDEVKGAVLFVECPRLLFPFARNILADVSRDGGFPPVMLGPVDFAQLYHQELARHAQSAEQNAGADGE
jgi:preprotein translocase subunit SecB